MISYTFRRIELWFSTSTLNDKYGEVTVYTGGKDYRALSHKSNAPPEQGGRVYHEDTGQSGERRKTSSSRLRA